MHRLEREMSMPQFMEWLAWRKIRYEEETSESHDQRAASNRSRV